MPALFSPQQRKAGSALVPALCPPQRTVGAGLVPALCPPTTKGRGKPCACPLPLPKPANRFSNRRHEFPSLLFPPQNVDFTLLTPTQLTDFDDFCIVQRKSRNDCPVAWAKGGSPSSARTSSERRQTSPSTAQQLSNPSRAEWRKPLQHCASQQPGHNRFSGYERGDCDGTPDKAAT